MDLSDIKNNLNKKISQMFSIEFGEEPYVIGAPHHTPGGVDNMPCSRKGDENAGFLALILGEYLRGQCIIANYYWLDPNKTCNDYLLFIKQKQPKFLIEIHGHNQRSANDIEISCGTRNLTKNSEELASNIHDELQKSGKFDGITVCGKFDNLNRNLRASNTLSLKSVREWGAIPYHIEIASKLRKDKNDNVPEKGIQLMEIIAKSIENVEGTE